MKTEPAAPKPVSGYLFALASTAIWSVNFLIARGLKNSVPPVSLAFLRWSLAALLFLPFAARGVVRERGAIRKHIGYLAAAAFLGVSIFNTLVYFAGRTTTALNLSLISLTFPIIVLLLSRIFFAERISRKRLAGILVVLAGVLLLLSGGRPADLLAVRFAAGDLLMLAAASVFAGYTLLVRRRPADLSLTSFQFCTFALGTIFLAPVFVVERAVSPPLVLDGLAIASVLYVGIFASLAAFLSWNKAVESIGAAKAGLVYYSLPVLSGLSAWAFLGEAIGAVHLVSMAVVIAGIALAGRK